jgi:hypothetical protein
MSLVRVRPGEWLAGAAAVLLIAAPFFDVLLTILALPGLALLVAQAVRRSPALPTALSIFTFLAGVAATIVAIVRLLASPGTAAWLVLGGALGLLTGGWWSLATEEVRGVPAPDVEVRPAP